MNPQHERISRQAAKEQTRAGRNPLPDQAEELEALFFGDRRIAPADRFTSPGADPALQRAAPPNPIGLFYDPLSTKAGTPFTPPTS